MAAVGTTACDEYALDLIAQPHIGLLVRTDVAFTPGVVAAG